MQEVQTITQPAIFQWISVLIALPFLGFLAQAFLGGLIIQQNGQKRGKLILTYLASAPIILSFILGLWITSTLIGLEDTARSQIVTLWNWINLESIRIPVEFLIDPLSMVMTLVITGVGALIHIYATSYMSEDKDFARFFTYMNLFIGLMLILVLGNNLALMFVGWEGVGLCSYLLIGFWYKDLANTKAANKAFIMNRIGDFGFILGLFMLIALMAMNAESMKLTDPRWLSFDILLPKIVGILKSQPTLTTITALLLFVGAAGKSAQLPLYNWLPDAMAGPTPVSALIHAATMVTAGIFLLNRMHVIFEMTPFASGIIAIIGAITALFAALIAFGQTDIKKVLAYSTVSQLGYMFIACGVGAYWVGIFHVVTHAFFKALLFLGAGAVIHAMRHEQDMRKYGNLWRYMPVTGTTMIIAWLTISGLPFFSGFWSKEAILGSAFSSQFAQIAGLNVGSIVAWIGLIVAILTAGYMTRMTLLTFGIPFKNGEERWRKIEPVLHHPATQTPALVSDPNEIGNDPYNFYDKSLKTPVAVKEEHHHELAADHNPREVGMRMSLPLVLLCLLSLMGGFILHVNHNLEGFLFTSSGIRLISAESFIKLSETWLGSSLMILSIGAALVGIAYGYMVYSKGLPEKEAEDESKWSKFRLKAKDQFGYDTKLTWVGSKLGWDFGRAMLKYIDKGIVDGAVNCFGYFTSGIGGVLRKFQTGYVRSYALMMMLGVVALIIYFLNVISKLGGIS